MTDKELGMGSGSVVKYFNRCGGTRDGGGGRLYPTDFQTFLVPPFLSNRGVYVHHIGSRYTQTIYQLEPDVP